MNVHDLDSTIALLNRSLSLRLERHSVITSNIANVDTPGYKAKQFSFESELNNVMKDGQKGQTVEGNDEIVQRLGRVSGKVFEVPDRPAGPDGNDVDLDKQMSSMSENTLKYQATAQFLYSKLSMLKFAASDGAGV